MHKSIMQCKVRGDGPSDRVRTTRDEGAKRYEGMERRARTSWAGQEWSVGRLRLRLAQTT